MQAAELLSADDHFALCDSCHARMNELQEGREIRVAAGRAFEDAVNLEPTHIDYEQMAGLVDDKLDKIDREIVESHLEMCSQCEAEVKDLRELRSKIGAPSTEYKPARVRSIRERLIALWRVPAFRISLQASGAVAAVALLAFLISVPVRKDNAELRTRLAELERSNQALAEQAAAAETAQKEVLALRSENERLRLSAAGADQILVALNDAGGRLTLDKQGNLAGVQTAAQYEQAIKDALRSERVRLAPSVRELRSQSGTLMGSSRDGFHLLSPVGVVIETDRPTFRWSALDGATSYTVSVYDSSLNRVATSDPLTATEWSDPTALPRGRVYVWQVRATKDGQQMVAPPPAAGRAKFKVLEQARVEEIARGKRETRSHLVMGLIYAETGLLNEAEQEFSELLRANPESPIARKLLQSVKAAKR